MAENREIAKEVIQAIGGQENIASFAHCATRLRIMVHDKEKIDQKKLRRSTRSRVLFQFRAISDYFWYGYGKSNF